MSTKKMEARIPAQALMVKEGLKNWDAIKKLVRQQNEKSLSPTYNSNFLSLPGDSLIQTHVTTLASDLRPTDRGNARGIITGLLARYSQEN